MKSVLLLFLILSAGSAYADDNPCDTSCPAGQTQKAFADGNTLSCVCLPASSMDATVPDAAIDDTPIEQAS